MNLEDYFPEEEFRDNQRQVIRAIEDKFKYYDNVILEAPTGTGKSPIAVAVARYFYNAHITTDQKSLQTQYLNDYSRYVEMVKGRSNFKCLQNGENCSVGHCKHGNGDCEHKPRASDEIETDSGDVIKPTEYAGESYSRGDLYWYSDIHCEYWKQKLDAINKPIVIFNYKYLLTELNYIQDFGPRDVLISDEGHNIESHILDFINVIITSDDLNEITSGEVEFKDYGDNLKEWNDWLERLYEYIPDKLDEIDDRLERLDNYLKTPYVDNITKREVEKNFGKNKSMDEIIGEVEDELSVLDQKKEKIKGIRDKIERYFEYYNNDGTDNWVVDVKYDWDVIDKVEFKPIFISNYAYENYFQFGRKNLIMSATVLNFGKMAESLGLDKKNTGFIKVKPVFPAENQNIYHLQTGRLDYKNANEDNPDNNLDAMVDGIDSILDIYPNYKGIIHANTYKIMNYIKRKSRHKDRIITHDSTSREEAIDEHISKDKPTILCSPSMTEGIDLQGEYSRLQFLVKVPYPYLGDPQIKKRKDKDPEYYEWQACRNAVQAKGRSIRSKDDWALTFTLDSRWPGFVEKNKKMLWNHFGQYVRPRSEFMKKKESRLESALSRNKVKLNWV